MSAREKPRRQVTHSSLGNILSPTALVLACPRAGVRTRERADDVRRNGRRFIRTVQNLPSACRSGVWYRHGRILTSLLVWRWPRMVDGGYGVGRDCSLLQNRPALVAFWVRLCRDWARANVHGGKLLSLLEGSHT